MMGAFPVDLTGHGDGLADPCRVLESRFCKKRTRG